MAAQPQPKRTGARFATVELAMIFVALVWGVNAAVIKGPRDHRIERVDHHCPVAPAGDPVGHANGRGAALGVGLLALLRQDFSLVTAASVGGMTCRWCSGSAPLGSS